MTRIRRILVSCAVVIIVFLGFYNFLIKPKIEQIRLLNKKHEDVAKVLESSKECIDKYKDVKSAFNSILSQWKVLEKSLPEEEEMPEILRAMHEIGKKSNVKSLLFKPLPKIPRDFYTENPITVKVIAGYHEVGRFMSEIAGLSRLVNVSKIRFVSSKSEEMVLEAEFIATAYITKK
ncbi:MAG: hypothetical protein COT09_04145 [Candidatus Hydromicrobium americanum]|nr:MAG: hypothetical protein COT09_04145 [Candidatus Hydromicrobium americanum]